MSNAHDLAVDSAIIEFAERAAAEVAETYRADPEAELFAWLRMAQRREAMVSESYSRGHVSAQLQVLALTQQLEPEVVQIVEKTLGAVWAQETSHDAYLASIIRVIDPPKKFLKEVGDRLDRIAGTVDGVAISSLVAPGPLRRAVARLALAVGSLVKDTPDFAAGLRARDFSSYCRLNRALEVTAVSGYRRMQHLITTVAKERFEVQTSTLAIDNARTWKDERYHEAIFERLATWSDPPPPPPGAPSMAVPEARANDSELASFSARQLVDEIVLTQGRVYGEAHASWPEPALRPFASDDDLALDPVVARLRQRARADGALIDTTFVAEEQVEAQPGDSEAEKTLEQLEAALPSKTRYMEG